MFKEKCPNQHSPNTENISSLLKMQVNALFKQDSTKRKNPVFIFPLQTSDHSSSYDSSFVGTLSEQSTYCGRRRESTSANLVLSRENSISPFITPPRTEHREKEVFFYYFGILLGVMC